MFYYNFLANRNLLPLIFKVLSVRPEQYTNITIYVDELTASVFTVSTRNKIDFVANPAFVNHTTMNFDTFVKKSLFSSEI
jgi:hypothetical protein